MTFCNLARLLQGRTIIIQLLQGLHGAGVATTATAAASLINTTATTTTTAAATRSWPFL